VAPLIPILAKLDSKIKTHAFRADPASRLKEHGNVSERQNDSLCQIRLRVLWSLKVELLAREQSVGRIRISFLVTVLTYSSDLTKEEMGARRVLEVLTKS
jgi:hypothetical protein